MRLNENGTDTLQWLLGDHLGSTSVTANIDGSLNGILKYSAFGEIWASNGTTLTDYRYTSQLSQDEIGLYYYNARWYDPAMGRFVQADTIVPGAGNASAYDRYAYVLNNPIKSNDPSGHTYCDFGVCPKPRGTNDEISLVRNLIKRGVFQRMSEGLSKVNKSTSAIQICGGYNLISLDDEKPNGPNPFYNEETGNSANSGAVGTFGVISALNNMALPFSNAQIIKSYYEAQGSLPNVIIEMYYSKEDSEISIYELTFKNLSGQSSIMIEELHIDHVEWLGEFASHKEEKYPIYIDKWYYGKYLPSDNNSVFVQLDPIIVFAPTNSIADIYVRLVNMNRESLCVGELHFDYERK